ncbi:MAG TPA: LysR substrate-binding domain-containing protein [Paenibacillus sp.]|jgi:DNA-binding transcriptional LysR family regulator
MCHRNIQCSDMTRPTHNFLVYTHRQLYFRISPLNCITLDQVADDSFIDYKSGHPLLQVNDEISRKAGIRRTIVCEVEEPTALGSLVQAGLGVAFVPGCKGDTLPQYTLLTIEGTDNRREYFADK